VTRGVVVCVVCLIALAPAGSRPGAQAQTKALPRLYVYTDESFDDGFLKEREQSVKDLREAIAGRKKVLALSDDKEHADVTVEVVERTTSVPKVRIGLAPPNSGEPGGSGPSRTVRLHVRARRGDDTIDVTNKNAPFENDRGWVAAADDVAKQIEKWIVGK